MLCEKHFKIYKRKFGHLIDASEQLKPNERFADKVREPSVQATQLEM